MTFLPFYVAELYVGRCILKNFQNLKIAFKIILKRIIKFFFKHLYQIKCSILKKIISFQKRSEMDHKKIKKKYYLSLLRLLNKTYILYDILESYY